MFKTRLLSGIVLVIILIATVGTGGGLLFGFLALISLIGLSELYKVVDVQNKILGLTGYLGAVVYYGILYTGQMQYVTLLTIAFLVVLMAVYVFSFPTFKAEQVMTVFFGVFYVAVMLSYVYQTRMLEDGAVAVWLIFLSSWGCDTCAYCAGMLLGKHKMAPVLSPKKSWEGAVGGVVGAALLTLIYCFVFQGSMGSTNRDIIMLCMICAIGAIISMIGDLTASAIKRNYDIKDYGRLIPGHGGILDRFDSVIFTAPIIYYLALYLIGK